MKRVACWLALGVGFVSAHISAEQFIAIGDYQAHYMILDTLSLEPEIAERYGIARARNQSILTVSLLDSQGASIQAQIEGTATNLLGNKRSLSFQAIQEGEAHYVVASMQHTEERMRFELTIQTPDGQDHQVQFEQRLYLGLE